MSAKSITPPRFFAVVPAAGSGARMGAERPKQYIELNQRPLLWHALQTLTRVQRIDSVCVVLAPDDEWWQCFDWRPLGERLRPVFVGGATRAHSVTNALAHMQAEDHDWVLVHDGARACLTVGQVDALIDALQDDPVGGLLAVPVADTLKRMDSNAAGQVAVTVPRDGLWQAQTPQMFRYGLLRRALAHTSQMPGQITDEASAVEALGLQPRLVAADITNFKVTYPQDLALAAQILQSRK